jgi:hypothetical protein
VPPFAAEFRDGRSRTDPRHPYSIVPFSYYSNTEITNGGSGVNTGLEPTADSADPFSDGLAGVDLDELVETIVETIIGDDE